jgi:hypothetical protein
MNWSTVMLLSRAMPVISSRTSSSVAMMLIFCCFSTRFSSCSCRCSSISEISAWRWNCGRFSWFGWTPEVAISSRIRCARS